MRTQFIGDFKSIKSAMPLDEVNSAVGSFLEQASKTAKLGQAIIVHEDCQQVDKERIEHIVEKVTPLIVSLKGVMKVEIK